MPCCQPVKEPREREIGGFGLVAEYNGVETVQAQRSGKATRRVAPIECGKYVLKLSARHRLAENPSMPATASEARDDRDVPDAVRSPHAQVSPWLEYPKDLAKEIVGP